MYIMCSECILLDKSHKEYDKSNNCYRYSCSKKNPHWWINQDYDLKKLSCGEGSKDKIQNVKNIGNNAEQLSLF